MASLWRTLSGSTGKEITHQHPLQVQLRPCQSLDINAGAPPTQQHSPVAVTVHFDAVYACPVQRAPPPAARREYGASRARRCQTTLWTALAACQVCHRSQFAKQQSLDAAQGPRTRFPGLQQANADDGCCAAAYAARAASSQGGARMLSAAYMWAGISPCGLAQAAAQATRAPAVSGGWVGGSPGFLCTSEVLMQMCTPLLLSLSPFMPAESLHSSSPTGSQLGAESPTAAQQQKQRRPYKIQGMDPYDYWWVWERLTALSALLCVFCTDFPVNASVHSQRAAAPVVKHQLCLASCPCRSMIKSL